MSRPIAILALVVALALTATGSAAASVRLGPDLTPTQDGLGYGCQKAPYSPCSYINLRSTGAPGSVPVAAPTAGVITKWRFRAACCLEAQTVPRTFTLKTFKQGPSDGLGGYGWVIAGGTGPSFVIPPGSQVQSDAPVELPARLPIEAGERVGIVADEPIAFASYNTPGVTLTILANGVETMGQQYGVAYAGALAINAEVEPDGDGDGYGDETQDCRPTDPALHEACPTVPSLPPISPPSAYIPGGGCTGACGGAGSVIVPIIQGPPVPRADGGIEIKLLCPPNAGAPCRGIYYAGLPAGKKPRPNARATATPRLLARASYSIQPGKKKTLKLTFTRKVRDFLALKPSRRVTVTVDPAVGDPVTRTVVLRFRAPK